MKTEIGDLNWLDCMHDYDIFTLQRMFIIVFVFKKNY